MLHYTTQRLHQSQDVQVSITVLPTGESAVQVVLMEDGEVKATFIRTFNEKPALNRFYTAIHVGVESIQSFGADAEAAAEIVGFLS